MTDPTPYTDDDVRHLVALIDEGQYHDSAIHPGSMARRLLAAGVTLPPEPDTPPEPQERYWVDQLEDWEVRSTGGERIHCYLSNGITLAPYAPLAEQVARLLNLDESVKGDVCSGLHEAYPALVEQLADQTEQIERLIGRRDELAKALTKARRDHRHAQSEARSEVGRLTAELTEGKPMTTPAHLIPEPMSDRGFKRLPPITDSYRSTSVRVYESSAAEEPHLWLTVTPPDTTTEAFAHLTADDAWRLKEQIEWLLRYHYQGDARPEKANR